MSSPGRHRKLHRGDSHREYPVARPVAPPPGWGSAVQEPHPDLTPLPEPPPPPIADFAPAAIEPPPVEQPPPPPEEPSAPPVAALAPESPPADDGYPEMAAGESGRLVVALQLGVIVLVAGLFVGGGYMVLRGPWRPKALDLEEEAPAVATAPEKPSGWVEIPQKEVELPEPEARNWFEDLDKPVAPEKTKPELARPDSTTTMPIRPEKSGDPSLGRPLFETHILPIFEARCVRCHGARQKKGGVDLRTVSAMLAKDGAHGTLVRGSTHKSPLWKVIASGKMPAAGPRLTEDEKELIRRWIITGAYSVRR